MDEHRYITEEASDADEETTKTASSLIKIGAAALKRSPKKRTEQPERVDRFVAFAV